MNTWIVLLRGVNVGGHNRIKMANLRLALTDQGFGEVRTHIQSGNIVMVSNAPHVEVEATVGAVLADRLGVTVPVMALPSDHLDAAVNANPYGALADAEPNQVHYYFLASPPDPTNADLDGLAMYAAPGEAFTVTDRVVYLHAPHGMARCKVAGQIERHVAVPATARNHRTVVALRDLAAQL
jgi:uncharacterized protein (DUF1697 family)